MTDRALHHVEAEINLSSRLFQVALYLTIPLILFAVLAVDVMGNIETTVARKMSESSGHQSSSERYRGSTVGDRKSYRYVYSAGDRTYTISGGLKRSGSINVNYYRRFPSFATFDNRRPSILPFSLVLLFLNSCALIGLYIRLLHLRVELHKLQICHHDTCPQRIKTPEKKEYERA